MPHKFMSTSGLTSGPVGPKPSIALYQYNVCNNPVSKTDNENMLLYLHNKCILSTASNEDIKSEIKRQRYLNAERLKLSTPKRLFKKMKGEHADLLCNNGIIRLGSLSCYERSENASINDGNEGFFICQAVGQHNTVYAVVRSNKHVLVYCVTKDSNAKFDTYDACVEISNPAEFERLLAMSIRTKFARKNVLKYSIMSECHYQHSRIVCGHLHGFAETLIDLGELSIDTMDVVIDSKFIIKERRFIADSEFRFAFIMQRDVDDYVMIECPDISRLCRRIE